MRNLARDHTGRYASPIMTNIGDQLHELAGIQKYRPAFALVEEVDPDWEAWYDDDDNVDPSITTSELGHLLHRRLRSLVDEKYPEIAATLTKRASLGEIKTALANASIIKGD